MDAPSGFRQRKSKTSSQKRRPKGQKGKPQLFEDTSMQQPSPQQGYVAPPGAGYSNYGYNVNNSYRAPAKEMGQGYDQGGYGNPAMQFPGQQFINDPMMTNMAMQYGSSLADQGKDYVNKNLEKYVSTSKLKYYFAVDTAYVGKKLGLLCFPFSHTDWSIKFNQDEPVAPRYEMNAPDLYIPVMAFVTYVLVAGIVMGTQNRFTPEQLGTQASTALVWLIMELVVLLLTFYVMNINTDLKYLDILAFCGYKFLGMIVSLLAGLLFQSTGYYAVLLWFSLCIAFFLIKSLRVQILPHSEGDGFSKGSKRSLYLILCISLVQPLMMWWLTSHIMFVRK
ncbi:protein YIF1B-B-like isoform X1 [Pecten maximus]|uniref:protein YIF1B-B-like isoform X1 n=1 Tax=Pecten maximus TaxID=6579 RepID=UPI0014582C1C|nr:protein YIF1B-B-like isoform X1 [Pecten maximus]